MEFKDRLKKYRKENNITQQQLATKLNVSRSTIAEIERGTIKGTVEFISKLSEISKKPMSYWVDESIENDYKIYQALDVLIDAMIDSERIKDDGKIQSEDKELIISVLEKEIKFKIKRKKGQA